AVLTWFIPAGHYSVDDAGNIVAGSYERVQQNPQGLWDIFMAPNNGMLGVPAGELTKETPAPIPNSSDLLGFGGFLRIINNTGALDAGIASVVKKFKGIDKMLIPE
ncbi:YfcC family protein, partial [Enterococcus faecium]